MHIRFTPKKPSQRTRRKPQDRWRGSRWRGRWVRRRQWKSSEVRTPAEPQPQNPPFQFTDEYHRQTLRQATVLFWISAGGATFAFGWVIYVSLITTPEQISTLLKVFSGTVSLLLFRQANQARKHATELYDRLREDERQRQLIAFVSTIDDAGRRDQIRAQIALELASALTRAAGATKGAAQEQGLSQLPARQADGPRRDSG